jgi:uncharacterized protein (DUF1015 family)
MAEIAPFSALRYAPDRAPDLAAVLAPPYDVISDGERRALEAREPHNIVRLELPRGEDDARYAGAATTLAGWTAEGILRPDGPPGLYVYDQQFTWAGTSYTRRGFFAAVRLEPFERRVILPHEKTLAGPKEDRRRLLRATRTQLSPIFGLYRDTDGATRAIVDEAAAGEPTAEAATPDGVRHRLWKLTDTGAIGRLSGLLAPKQILIADGHHRYETQLAMRSELRPPTTLSTTPSAAPDFAMMFLAPAESPGLLVLPTHRLVKNLQGFDFAGLCAAAKAAFDITGGDERTPEAIDARLAREGAGGRVVFAVRVPGEFKTTWFVLKSIVDLSALGPPLLRKLDVTVLHGVILGSLLGIDAAALASQIHLDYTHDTKDAVARVAAGQAQVAFLMNPTRTEQVLAACEAGLVLPQKSTYFHPKLATGLVMYRLSGPTPRPVR